MLKDGTGIRVWHVEWGKSIVFIPRMLKPKSKLDFVIPAIGIIKPRKEFFELRLLARFVACAGWEFGVEFGLSIALGSPATVLKRSHQKIFMKLYSPMLAKIGSEKDLERSDMIYELKFDGTRALCYKTGNEIKFLNRRGKRIDYRYPELKGIFRNITKDCVLDGEIVVFNSRGLPDFSLLQEREHVDEKLRTEMLAKIHPACYVVFDVLEVEGTEVTRKPLIERKRILESIIVESERIKKSVYTRDGRALFDFAKRYKLEGVMAKDVRSPYVQKRSGFWLKIKLFKTLDCVVCGYTEGEGEREKFFGALLAGIWLRKRLHYLGRVGTGFDEAQMRMLMEKFKELRTRQNPFDEFEESQEIMKKIRWLKPSMVMEVKFMYLTEDIKLRAPVFLRMREDKAPEECVLTEEEIEKLTE